MKYKVYGMKWKSKQAQLHTHILHALSKVLVPRGIMASY
jgi:hypothetical protein